MDIKPSDETTLRQYLLGTLPEIESTEIDQKLMTDENFACTVEMVEDEIIEDYLDATLTGDETQAAERHFFHSPEHQRKLHFARLLRAYSSKKAPATRQDAVALHYRPTAYWVTTTAWTSLLILAAGLGLYAIKLRRDLQSEIAKESNTQSTLQADLARERSNVTQLKEALRLLQNNSGGGSQGTITVTPAPLERDVGVIPQASLGPEWLEIHIPIVDFGSPLSSATLKDSKGKVVWSSSPPKPTGRVLVLRVACKLLFPGQYYVVLTGAATNRSLTYTFRLVVSR